MIFHTWRKYNKSTEDLIPVTNNLRILIYKAILFRDKTIHILVAYSLTSAEEKKKNVEGKINT